MPLIRIQHADLCRVLYDASEHLQKGMTFFFIYYLHTSLSKILLMAAYGYAFFGA